MQPRKRKLLAGDTLAGDAERDQTSLDEGDLLLVTRLDRLARSTRDLLNIVHAIGERGAAFKSLADAWADTTTPHGKLMLTILGGLAEFGCVKVYREKLSGARAQPDQRPHGRRPRPRQG